MKTLRITFDEYPDDWIDTIISPVGVGTLLDIIAKSSRVSLTREAFGELYGLFARRGRWNYPEPVGPDGPVARFMNQILAVIMPGPRGPQAPPLPRRSSDNSSRPAGLKPRTRRAESSTDLRTYPGHTLGSLLAEDALS